MENDLTPAGAEAGPAFLSADADSHDQLRAHAVAVATAVSDARRHARPFSGTDPAALAAAIAAIDPCPEEGVALNELLSELGEAVLAKGVHVSDPFCAAHLQCPTLLAAAAAELAIGATNQSMDSFDQAPAATFVEDHVVRWLAGMIGLSDGSGVLTSGGTASNLLGLFLARERASARADSGFTGPGLPPQHARWRIIASAAAHDSIRRSASVLGLGAGSVVSVATDCSGRIDTAALDAELDALARDNQDPIAFVATAGTTDLGAIDPLTEIAERARAWGAWMHVDAALGSALSLSPRLAPMLAGIEHADSITADLHKLWFMPIAASALLVRDIALLDSVGEHNEYLHRADDHFDGVLNLVGRSLETSRRFDALKILIGLRHTGKRRMSTMIEHLVDLAHHAARTIDQHADLELPAEPSTVTVVFRWRPAAEHYRDDMLDAINVATQRALLHSGRAIIGRTRLDGRVALKLTLVNPLARSTDVRTLLALVAGTANDELRNRRTMPDRDG